MNLGQPKDRFDEQELERGADGHPAIEEPSEISDDIIIQIIEIFADEKSGYYYGKDDRIGSKEDCIKWIKDILRKGV